MSGGSILGGVVGFVIGGFMGGPGFNLYTAYVGFTIGYGIGSMIDPLDPDNDTGAPPAWSLNEASKGMEVTDLLGISKIGGNILWYGDKDRDKDDDEYTYQLTWWLGICKGPVDAILGVYRNGETVWQGYESLSDNPSGKVVLSMGDGITGTNEKIDTVRFEYDSKNNSSKGWREQDGKVRIKGWAFKNYTISPRSIVTAEAMCRGGVDRSTMTDIEFLSFWNGPTLEEYTLITFDTWPDNCSFNDEYGKKDLFIWLTYVESFKETSTEGDQMGDVIFYFGTDDQVDTGSGSGRPTANMRGLCWASFQHCYLGGTSVPTMSFIVAKYPTFSTFTNTNIQVFDDYNPAHALYYMLTVPGKMSTDFIDVPSLNTLADDLYIEDMGVSFLMEGGTKVFSYVESILQHIDATMTYKTDASGNPKFHFKLLRGTEDTSNLPTINEGNLLVEPTLTRPTWLETHNEIKAKHYEVSGYIEYPPFQFSITTLSYNLTFALPLKDGGTYNFIVNWGDNTAESTITAYNDGAATHVYGAVGSYNITIKGIIDGFSFYGPGEHPDRNLIDDVTQWGCLSLGSFNYTFYKCENLQITATDTPDLGKTTSFAGMFLGCDALTGVPNIGYWDTSRITSMFQMFYGAEVFDSDISGWDVSNVTNMAGMFMQAYDFNQDLSGWDVSSVTNMASMFYQTYRFDQDVSGWETGNVEDFSFMFYNTSVVTPWSPNCSSWDVSSAILMQAMFNGANPGAYSLNSWDVSNVTNMNSMFAQAGSFNGDCSSWVTSSCTNMYRMFYSANQFNQDIGGWDVSKVESMEEMFRGAQSFNQDLDQWDVSSSLNFYQMFREARDFNGSVAGWTWHPSLTSLHSMFRQSGFNHASITTWDVSNIAAFVYMFYWNQAFNQDIGGWTTTNMQSIGGMFQGASAFEQDISGWDVSNVTSANNFFESNNMTTVNYDALLIGWAPQSVQSGVTLEMNNSVYTSGGAAAAARATLTGKGWDIDDGGGT